MFWKKFEWHQKQSLTEKDKLACKLAWSYANDVICIKKVYLAFRKFKVQNKYILKIFFTLISTLKYWLTTSINLAPLKVHDSSKAFNNIIVVTIKSILWIRTSCLYKSEIIKFYQWWRDLNAQNELHVDKSRVYILELEIFQKTW